MNKDLIKRGIEKMGANVAFTGLHSFRRSALDFDIDVVEDKKKGSFFSFGVADEDVFNDFTILDIDPKDRHLLLMKKEKIMARDGKNVMDMIKHRLLLGHDERDWFCAAVPGNASTIQQAKDELRPDAATHSIKKRGKIKNRNKRKNKGFKRQGEWFFIPTNLNLDDEIIHSNEPIVRTGGGKPHIVSEIVRMGGHTVYTHPLFEGEIGQEQYSEIMKDPTTDSTHKIGWQTWTRDATVYGRGTVRHPDHKTIKLPGWHLILANLEDKTPLRRNLTFLD